MTDSQNSKKIITELKQIYSLEQLLSSYLVAECIIEIRGEREVEIKKMAKDSIPKLTTNNQVLNMLYERFAAAVNYKPTFVVLAKLGLEDIENYDFQKDPSVVTTATTDTAHLQQAFGPSYSSLSKINLFDHTLRVFKIGIEAGEKQGRVMQTAIPMLGCLFHDFGKSSKIRIDLMGDQVGKGYKAHADVSQMYIREILAPKFHKFLNENATETIEALSISVQNHHPSNNKIKNDTTIRYITAADITARKEEIAKLKNLNSEGE